ncbi:MAG: FHA domain-containing protein [Ignavibacteriales bacterium]|nr:FHA domain-containing protein [Ignavibacteriales bacterium]
MKTLALCMLSVSFLLGQSPRVVPHETYKSGQDSIAIEFRILDGDGRTIESLPPDDVRLLDQGNEVADFTLEYKKARRSERTYFVLVLDASGSMRFDGKIDKLKASSFAFIDAMSPDDFCSIVVFTSQAHLLAGFTSDKNHLKEKIWGIVPKGQTAIYDGVYEAMNQLQARPLQRNKQIILMCDGEDEAKSLFSVADIIQRVQEIKNVNIHILDVNTKREVSDLRRLAQLSGGTYMFAPTSRDVSSGMVQFLNQHQKMYHVTFRAGKDEEPTMHKVTVTLFVEGVQHRFETEYEGGLSKSDRLLSGSAMYYAGGIFLILAGFGAVVVFIRKRKDESTYSLVQARGQLSDEPRLVLNSLNSFSPNERTETLTSLEDDDEKTVILDQKKRKQNVLGYLAVKGPGKDELVEIETHEVLIGRSLQCKVLCSDQSVSRLHAKIRKESEGLVIYDLGSANGTFVNGEEIQKYVLKEGDRIEVGNYTIGYEAVGKSAETHVNLEAL